MPVSKKRSLILLLLSIVHSVNCFQPWLYQTTPRHRLPTASHDRRLSSRFMAVAVSKDVEETGHKDNSQPAVFEPLGVGIRRDFGRRLPLYKSDITDGLNAQALACVLFLFFACLAPAIGFGGIMDVATNGAMGTKEMTLSTAVCGTLYALCAAQPTQLIGSMGQVLAYTVSLFQLAEWFKLPFLPLYTWTGLWMSGMLMTAALTSASNLSRYLTRFTDEIFSVLMSVIFLVEAFTNIAQPFSSPAVTASQALLGLLCASVTFLSAKTLRGLKESVYFTKSIRTNLSNFAPFIGVVLGSWVARMTRMRYGSLFGGLPSIDLPSGLATTTGRPWLVPLWDLPLWARLAACVPAFFGAVLLFLDQNITARVVNQPNFKMVKGRDTDSLTDGMHGDMAVMAILTGLSSLFGLPWMAGATTRSAGHVRALSVLDDDGKIQGTLENRVTGVAIHTLIGLCAVLPWPRQVIAQVPLPVLFGVFLYLGFTSLQGLELYDRMKGLFAERGLATKKRWSKLPFGTTNLLTMVQLSCVGGMMWVTKSSFGVVSPLMIALLPLLRRGLMKFNVIKEDEMKVLDPDPV